MWFSLKIFYVLFSDIFNFVSKQQKRYNFHAPSRHKFAEKKTFYTIFIFIKQQYGIK